MSLESDLHEKVDNFSDFLSHANIYTVSLIYQVSKLTNTEKV